MILMLLFAFSAFAGSCTVYNGTNKDSQDYATWSTTVKSYLHNCSDGKLMKVQYLSNGNCILVEYHDNSFNRLSDKTINMELPVFGGFYAVGDTYFVLTGQNNPSENNSLTCFAITKYDKNWSKIATAELKNCNTTIPFDAGSARFCHSGNYLIIRTSHEMYKADDGYNHQANVTIQVDISSMTITDSFTKVSSTKYGYVSHSFNQFVKIDSDKIVALDHGDAYPRSIVLTKYPTSVSSGKFTPAYTQTCTTVDVFSISGTIGNNYTGCSVGGFEVTSSGYLAVLNSNAQGTNSAVRDIYISYVSRGGDSAVTQKIADYSSAGASTPHLVRIDNDNFMVLWSFGGKVYYCKTDSQGALKSSILSISGSLSDCQPIIRSGKVLWYVWNSDKTEFYTIDLSDISKSEKRTFAVSHSYSAVSDSGTDVKMRCSDCGAESNGKIPSKFNLKWAAEGSSDYYSGPETSYHTSRNIGLYVDFASADLNEFDIVSSDENIVSIYQSGGRYYAKTIAEGTAKVTVKSRYNPDIKTEYIVNVSHNWQISESISATCTDSGKTVRICDVCGEKKTETQPATGHKMSGYVVVTKATCKQEGSKKSTCSVCGYGDIVKLPKTDHDSKITVDAVAPTCTKQGKTEGKKCSVCDKIIVQQESVPALGHDYAVYKITKNPTCTAQGEETATCTRCTGTKTQSVPRIAHTEVTVKAVAPTCTKQGKTAGKKCSVCDKITVEQESVPALGHDYAVYKITKNPTCTAQGEETATCTRCTGTKTQSVPRIAHTEVTVKAVAPTCTKQGKTAGKKCSVCDKIIAQQESVPALGHDYAMYKITKNPTCTAQGEETATCTRCTSTKTQSVPRIDHTEVTVKAVATTCTKQGKTEGKKCSVCDKITVEQESVPALGHDLGSYEITKEPTCTAKGEKTAKCTRCTYTKTADIAKTSHTEVTVKAVKATCTKNGKTAGAKCSVCDKVITSQESIPALGHSKKVVVLTKATTKANGKKSTVCERCGKDFGETRIYRIQTITLAKVKYTCDGKAKTPAVTVVDYNKDTLIKDRDYTVTYQSGRKDIGSYSVKVKFQGSYSGTTTLYFDIIPAQTTDLKAAVGTTAVTLKWAGVKGASGYKVYLYDSSSAEYKEVADTAKLQRKITGLKTGTKYKFAVRAYGKKSDGKTYLGVGKTISVITKLNTPGIALKASGKTVTVTWNKISGATNYQLWYSTKENSDYKKLTDTTKLTISKSGLTSGKTYYFKVRAYKRVGDTIVYSAFSKVVSVKIK